MTISNETTPPPVATELGCKRPLSEESPSEESARKMRKILTEAMTQLPQPSEVNCEFPQKYLEITAMLASNYILSLSAASVSEREAIQAMLNSGVFDEAVLGKIRTFLNMFHPPAISTDHNSLGEFKKLIEGLDDLLGDMNHILAVGSVTEMIAAKDVLYYLGKIAYVALTQINVRRVHATLVLYIKSFSFSAYNTAQIMVGNLREDLKIDRLKQLAITWDKACQVMKNYQLPNYFLWNIPNKTFELQFTDEKTLTFFRFGTPENTLMGATPVSIYRAMLDHHNHSRTRHMDFSLLRMKDRSVEVERTNLRMNLQNDFTGVLIAWAFDFYSDFSLRGMPYRDDQDNKYTAVDILYPEFMQSMFAGEGSPFMFPYMAGKLEEFKVRVAEIFSSVQTDFFGGSKFLSEKKITAFIDLTVVRILEDFCETYTPRTCDTACYSHIDRGMAIMNILYYYLLIKKNLHTSEEYLSYMEDMIFAPSMFIEHRPPHSELMMRLLNTLSFMQSDEVVERVQSRESFFSQATLKIPEWA